jgi:GT2 family glycosyltransferase
MRITVIVPTFRRPDDLVRCLAAIKAQTRQPDQTIVVVRDIDGETIALLDGGIASPSALQRVVVDEPGQVAALNAGLQQATGDIVAITDDDAAPHPKWLEHAEQRLAADVTIGGVGGPDWLDASTTDGSADVTGRLQWFGRIDTRKVGVTDVDILKGCNMVYRRSAIGSARFDQRLRGSGAQVFNDFAFSLTVRRRGWRLVSDPDVAIDHYQAARSDEDQRGAFVAVAHSNASHNRVLLTLDHLGPWRAPWYLGYALLIGSRPFPGVASMVRSVVERQPRAISFWWATVVGQLAGLRTFAMSTVR